MNDLPDSLSQEKALATSSGRRQPQGERSREAEPLIVSKSRVSHVESPGTVEGRDDQRIEPSSPVSRTSRASSDAGSSSDLELEEMGREDPLHITSKAEAAAATRLAGHRKRSVFDKMIERNMSNGGSHADREARKEGTRQFVEKTLINLVLISLW